MLPDIFMTATCIFYARFVMKLGLKTTEDTPSSFRGFPYSGFDDFRLAEEIGSGSDCKIYHVQKLTNYALKIIGWEGQDNYNSALRI